MTSLAAIPLVPGTASGEVLALAEPLSFWGGYDAATGRIIDRWHPDHGSNCAGKTGSFAQHGTSPAPGSIILMKCPTIGAFLPDKTRLLPESS